MKVRWQPLAFFTARVDSRVSPARENVSRRVLYLLIRFLLKNRPTFRQEGQWYEVVLRQPFWGRALCGSATHH